MGTLLQPASRPGSGPHAGTEGFRHIAVVLPQHALDLRHVLCRLEKLAEYGWKPHRFCLVKQKNSLRVVCCPRCPMTPRGFYNLSKIYKNGEKPRKIRNAAPERTARNCPNIFSPHLES